MVEITYSKKLLLNDFYLVHSVHFSYAVEMPSWVGNTVRLETVKNLGSEVNQAVVHFSNQLIGSVHDAVGKQKQGVYKIYLSTDSIPTSY